MTQDRHLDWEDCVNARDLGSMKTVDGHRIRWRAIVRSDSIDNLTGAGWQALIDYGVRTIVDLRNNDERKPVPDDKKNLTIIHLPLDGVENRDFWGAWEPGSWESGLGYASTPLYYAPHLEQMPERSASVLKAIASAQPGTVLVHCVGVRDRTGLIVILILHLMGVPVDDIFCDYAMSDKRLRQRSEERGEEHFSIQVDRYLEEIGTSYREIIYSFVANTDIRGQLVAGGMEEDEIAALQSRLLG